MAGPIELPQIPIEDTKRLEDLSTFQMVDFGSVQPGRTYTKEIKLGVIYEATHVTATTLQSPLDKMITMEYKKGNTLVFTYRPTLPGRTTLDVYYMQFEDKSRTAIVAKGRTLKPRTVLSNSRLCFTTSDQHPVAEFFVYLENHSQGTDYFQWDASDEDNSVTAEPKCGKIRPGAKIRVYIRVEPNHEGLFWRSLFCLMKYQEPLALVFTGLHSNDSNKPDLSRVIHLNETLPCYRTEFCRYVGDCWRVIFPESHPLVAMSTRYLHFGTIPWTGSSVSSTARVFTVTNHGLKALTIVWEKDKLDVFEIEPQFSTVQARESTSFVVKFLPGHPNQFYSTELIGMILWGSNLDFLVPFSLSIGLSGNSFSVDGCNWKFSYKLDRTLIVFPGTVPGIPVYTSFKLKRTSEQPIFFRVYPADPMKPPELSSFLVKPAQGLVTEDFQIIIVQMFPGDLPGAEIIEEWILCINSVVKVKLTFCGTCELPYVLIGNSKLIEFPPTTIGALTSLAVPIRNTTRLNLKCKPLTEPDNGPEFELGPGEQSVLPVSFNPRAGPMEFNWAIALDVVWHHGDDNVNKLLQGGQIMAQTVVRCHGRSVPAMVEANPQSITMNNLIIRRAKTTSLKIQNNGEGVVYLGLSVKPTMFGTENALITIHPDELIIQPSESKQVIVSILTRKVGYNCFEIAGTFYESAKFQTKISDEISLLFMDFFSSFPTLKIIDIQYEGLNQNVCKLTLWNLLRINNVNDTLMNLSSMKQRTCCMHLPPSCQSSSGLHFQLLIQSITEVPLTVSIARCKNCKCDREKVSRRYRVTSCPHDQEVVVRLSKNELKPCAKTVLSFYVNYTEPLDDPFKFILTIATTGPSNLKTKVTLLLFRPVVLMKRPRLELSLPPTPGCSRDGYYTWCLEPLCVNLNSKYIQILWLWNESINDVIYTVEWISVDPQIFHLINPSGSVESSFKRPLLLMCSPCEFKDYFAEMLIRCGDDDSILCIVRVELRVSTNSIYDARRMMNKMPPNCLFDNSKTGLKLSVDHMCIQSLPTHSYERRIFFMKNTSEDTLKFHWLECKVWSVLEATVVPQKGVLSPGEVCSCILQIQSSRFPAKVSFALSCLVINLSKFEVYWASNRLNKRASAALFDSMFTLSDSNNFEKSVNGPEKELESVEKPQAKIVSLGVSLHVFSGDQIEFLCPDAQQQLELVPNLKSELLPASEPFLIIKSPEVPDLILDVLRTAVSQILKSSSFKLTFKNRAPVVKYALAKNHQEAESLPKTLQGYYMASLVSRAVYTSVTDMFGCEATESANVPDKSLELTKGLLQGLNNAYYQDILSGKFSQVQGLPKEDVVESESGVNEGELE